MTVQTHITGFRKANSTDNRRHNAISGIPVKMLPLFQEQRCRSS